MKTAACYFLFSILLACNAQNGSSHSATDSAGNAQPQSTALATPGCGNSILFSKGVVMEATTYDGAGKQTYTSVATVTGVDNEGGAMVSHVESKMKMPGSTEEKVVRSSYKCDGQNLTIDLSNMLDGTQSKSDIQMPGLSFPVKVTEGETLPDATYSMVMERNGKTIKVTSHVTQRKVEAKEQLAVGSSTYTCYKISSVIDAGTEMSGMSEKTKQAMEAMRAKLPKNRMIIWYAPDATILQSEYYMGDKLVTRNQVTAIRK